MTLFDSIRTVFRRTGREAAEFAYLNEATSRVDLEMRQREIDRGRFSHLPRRR
ncbi:MAG: DUF3563 family protein [Devosia sp.]